MSPQDQIELEDGPSEGSDGDSAEREDIDEDCDHSEEADASEEDE